MIFITPKLESVYLRDKSKYDLSRLINKKDFTVSDTPLSYRQINTLSKDSLFPEERANQKGWRKFSLKEIIYFSLIYELKKFGLAHEVLKNLSNSFFMEKTAEIAIGCVLVQSEIIVVIGSNGSVTYYDPPHYLLVGTGGLPVIHIQLNSIVNKIRKDNNQKLFTVKSSIRDYLWNKTGNVSENEKQILKIIHDDSYSTISIKKTNGKTSIVHAEKSISTSDLSKQEILDLINAKDFQDIGIVKRDGNIVSFKVGEKIKLGAE